MALGDNNSNAVERQEYSDPKDAFTLTRDQVNSLYQQYYGVTDDAQADKWVEWAKENGVKDLRGLANTFKGEVTKDYQKRGLNELPEGATSKDFLTNYNLLIEMGVDPTQAYNQTKKELTAAFPVKEKTETDAERSVRLEKEFNDLTTPENIEKYQGIVKNMYDPAFNKQAKNIAEQYAGMGRDYKGDAYNRAMAGLAGDYSSKTFNDALNLIGQTAQNKATGAGLGLDYSKLGTSTMLQGKQNDYSTLMGLLGRTWDSADYNQSAELAKELARMQKTPEWKDFLDSVGSIIPG